MTSSLVVLFALAAAPAVDTRWSWAFDDTRTIKVKGAPAGANVSISPHLEESLFEIRRCASPSAKRASIFR